MVLSCVQEGKGDKILTANRQCFVKEMGYAWEQEDEATARGQRSMKKGFFSKDERSHSSVYILMGKIQ